jgi:hypothetical protein
MRKAMIAVLVVGIVAGLSTASFAQRSVLRQYQGPVSQEAFNRCYHLALQRGINVSRGDQYIMDRFISACLNGRVRH